MRLGHGPRRTVVILWAWTALLSGVALVPTYFPRSGSNALVPFIAAALALLLLAWFHPGIRSRRERHERERHPTAQPAPEAVVDLAERRRRRA
jgi:UDP-GlcNAc:undecaprenyl-phosphate GlcNAc-1-phosphate transferase